MRIFFALISAIYIFSIFFLAESTLVNNLSGFNPFSLLHIPLYGLLSIFLFLSVQNRKSPPSKTSYLLVVIIAGVVGVLDEIHQSFLPTREASKGDVLLDLVGVFLGLLVIRHFFSVSQANSPRPKQIMDIFSSK